ncbi:MAG TPA: MmgE/PrpD family protein [Bryobacteraceae bacterium]|nr:MmgE/PrpD family protein [Bryobacteraceae bacterium]
MNETRELVQFLAALNDLPAEVEDRTRYLLLDYLGVAIRGSRAESSTAVYKMIHRLKARSLPTYTALAYGTAAHAIEMDDTHNAGSIHLGVVIFSTALALMETLPDLPAERFISAVVAGYEAAARVAVAARPKQQYSLGFHPTSTCGVFGAAITAAKLLDLTPQQTLSAFGIAGSMAAGSLEFLAEGAWTKRLHPGLAAQNGIQAALLASEGFRGPSTILEGRDGFLHGYSRDPLAETLTADLGASFEIMRTSVKPHACCRYMQGPIDAILDLVRQHGFRPHQVRAVTVTVLEAGWPLVVEPRAQKYNPQSVVEAQFSMPFAAAVALLFGAAGIDQFREENVRSDEVRRMMRRVEMIADDTLEENFPLEWPARARIELTDGRRLEKHVEHPKGDPENPLTWDELIAKFKLLVEPCVTAERADEMIAGVRGGNCWRGLLGPFIGEAL